MKKDLERYSFDTKCAVDFFEMPSQLPEQLPIFATSGYEMGSLQESIEIFSGQRPGFVYSRYDNPTVHATAMKIALMEATRNGEEPVALMTSSGMSAISSTLLSLLSANATLYTHHGLYGGSTEVILNLQSKIGFSIVYIDFNDPDQYLKLIEQGNGSKIAFFETPSNPMLRLIDLSAVLSQMAQRNVVTVVDNTIATPLLQSPLALGADYVIYSTTKYHSGHGQATAGAVIGRTKTIQFDEIVKTVRLMGANCSPFEAWMTYTGMKTMALRVERQCNNAVVVAKFLAHHPLIRKVNHPSLEGHPDHQLALNSLKGFPALMSFEIDTDDSGMHRFFDHLELITHAPTLGDLNSLVLHPVTSSHRNIPEEIRIQQGIGLQLVRLSVGIENVQDLIDDLTQALLHVERK